MLCPLATSAIFALLASIPLILYIGSVTAII
jgi:hypothetical protein